jgi:hypothetical protein
MCVSGIDVACFYDGFSINLWNCSDSVVFLVLFYPSMLSYWSTKALLGQFKFNGCSLNQRKYEIGFVNDYQNKIIFFFFKYVQYFHFNCIWYMVLETQLNKIRKINIQNFC